MRYWTVLASLLLPLFALAKDPDRIVGVYYTAHQGEESKIRVFKEDDGSYTAQVIWVRDNLDENGEVEKDVKNPDKSKRDTPCDQIVLIEKMTYNEKKDSWGDEANVTCSFESVSKLRVRGSVLGIGETVYWDKIE